MRFIKGNTRSLDYIAQLGVGAFTGWKTVIHGI